MKEIVGHIYLPADKNFLTVEDATRHTAVAIWPYAGDDEPFERVLKRTACCNEHARFLVELIHRGTVVPRNPLSYVPEPDRAEAGLKQAVISLSDFKRFAKLLFIGVQLLDDDVANEIGYTIRGAAKALAEKYDVSEEATRDRIFEAAERGDLEFRDPKTGLPYVPRYRRDYWERIRIVDLNAWFEKCSMEYRLDLLTSAMPDEAPNEGDKPTAMVWTGERKRELREEHAHLIAKGHKSPTKELARKHGVSEARIRELKSVRAVKSIRWDGLGGNK